MTTAKADTAAKTAAPTEPHNYRLAVDPHGAHGYEVGYWPEGADLNDPAAFVVVAKCYTQAEAQALASQADGAAQVQPSEEPSHKHPEDEDESRHVTRHRK
jgi:hypothetical protein